MKVFRSVKSDNFLMLSKEVLFRKDLSLQAKALHAVLMSLNDSKWELTLSGLATLSTNGISATRSAMTELEEKGYVVKEQVKDDKGKFGSYEYIVYEMLELVEQPKLENHILDSNYPKLGFPKSDNRTLLSTNSIENYNKHKTYSVAEQKNDIHKEVIDYLNFKTNSKFKHTTAETKRLINGRLKEGYELNDFKKVIDIKTDEWMNDQRMSKYLRPQTLFRPSNFESYLNQQKEEKSLTKELAYDSIKSGGRLF